MELLTPQTVSSKKSTHTNKPTHIGTKSTTPPKSEKKKALSDRDKKGDINPIITPEKYNVFDDILIFENILIQVIIMTWIIQVMAHR